MIAKYFITVWLRRDDDPKDIPRYDKVMTETVAKHGNAIDETKKSSNGRRLTILGSCDIKEGQDPRDEIDSIAREISEKTGHVAKGKTLKK